MHLDVMSILSTVMSTDLSISTIVALCVAGYVTWKLAHKVATGLYGMTFGIVGTTFNTTSRIISLFPAGLVATTLLAVGGSGLTGYGFDLVRSEDQKVEQLSPKPFTNAELIKLAQQHKDDTAAMKLALEHAERRDKDVVVACQVVSTNVPKPTEPSVLTNGWTSILTGLGMLLSAMGVCCYRFVLWRNSEE